MDEQFNSERSDQAMQKNWLKLTIVIVIAFFGVSIFSTNSNTESMNEDVKLTEEQKEEMAYLHQSVLNQKIGIVKKYVEYGVLTEEKGQKIIAKLEKRYEKLEKNGFIPKWDHKDKKDIKHNPKNW